ncbi:hypothetical protein BJX62DRAFT_232645 [Aspergillus germanicus]
MASQPSMVSPDVLRPLGSEATDSLSTSASGVSTGPPVWEPRYHTLDKVQNLCPQHSTGPKLAPKCTLGDIETLPRELLSMVLTALDLHPLINFLRVKKLAFISVQPIPQFKIIAKSALNLLRSINSTGPGQSFPLQDLHDKLYTTACESCVSYGGFPYIIFCFSREQSYIPPLQTDVRRKFALRPEHLASLPKIKSIPGPYSERSCSMSRRLTLFGHDAAREAGLALHGSEDAMTQRASAVLSDKLDRYHSRRSQQTDPTKGKALRRPRRTDESDMTTRNPKRFITIVREPSLDRTGALKWWG